MNARLRGLSLLAASTVLVCCAGEEVGRTFTPVPGTPIGIDSSPRLSLGLAEGDMIQEFFRVGTPFLLSDGRLVVPLRGDNELRVFSPDGDLLQRLGTKGEGPGEFVALTESWPRADTIEAFDNRLARLTRFLPDGSVEVVRLQTPVGLETAAPGALADGWVAAAFAGAGPPGRDVFGLHLFSREGLHSGEVGRVEGMLRISVPGFTGPHPLSPRAVVRIGLGRLYFSETMKPRIMVLDGPGGVEREITWLPDDPLDPQAALLMVRDSANARRDRGAPAPVSEQLLQTDEIRVPVPAIWDFMVDELGFIWLSPYDASRHGFVLGDLGGGGYLTGGSLRGGLWRILSPDGVEAGYIEVPEGLRLAQITRDAVVGVRSDPILGFESVHIHPLRRH